MPPHSGGVLICLGLLCVLCVVGWYGGGREWIIGARQPPVAEPTPVNLLINDGLVFNDTIPQIGKSAVGDQFFFGGIWVPIFRFQHSASLNLVPRANWHAGRISFSGLNARHINVRFKGKIGESLNRVKSSTNSGYKALSLSTIAHNPREAHPLEYGSARNVLTQSSWNINFHHQPSPFNIYQGGCVLIGVAGVVTHLAGKQPPDTQAWVLGEDAPAFLRSEGPLYGDGPIWRLELAVPAAWADTHSAATSSEK